MRFRGSMFAVLLLTTAWLRPGSAQEIGIDGGSTLYPLLHAAAAEFAERSPAVTISVGFSGTAGGFELICRNLVELIGASRRATALESEACAAEDIQLVELPLAFDRITVVVSSRNDWLDCLTLSELRRLWAENSTVMRWNELRPGWPDREIALYAPGVASGTHDVFVEQVLGGGSLRTDFYPSEDDALLAHAVAEQEGAISFFGQAQYQLARSGLRPVAIDEGDGCADPGSQAGRPDGSSVLVRPLFLYLNAEALEATPEVTEFVELLLSPWGIQAIADLGYLPLDDEGYLLARERLREGPRGAKRSDGG